MPHLLRLLKLRIERINPGMGLEQFVLVAPHTELLDAVNLGAGLAGETLVRDPARLVDVVAGRIGARAVFRNAPVPSALMNAYPMGFYAPAQIVRDAREHGVEVRPPCINASRWDCTLEATTGRYFAVRLGLRQVRGLSNADGAAILGARGTATFGSVEEVWRRSGVQRAAIEKLADADAFHTFGADRRQGLWKVRGLGEAPLPLFAAADRAADGFSAEGREPAVALRPLTDGRELIEDYRALQLSLRAHPLTFLRDELTRCGVTLCGDLAGIRDGRHVEVAGIILVRQKPGSAKGVLFITIEDETGIANGILWPDRFEAQRGTVMSKSMIGMKGRVQKEGEVIHVICDRIIDHGVLLHRVGEILSPPDRPR